MRPRDPAGPRAVRDALEALAAPRAPPPFVMPGKVKIEERAPTSGRPRAEHELAKRAEEERIRETMPNKEIEVGPSAKLPPWFVPLDLCHHGLKPGLCGACTERNTG